VADRLERGTDGATQRLRGYLPHAAEGLVPPGCAVTILADRGFGDHKLFKFLDGLDL
jgi:hypothetical protein